MTRDVFGSLFDLQDRRLAKLVNPLIELDQVIDGKRSTRIMPAPNPKIWGGCLKAWSSESLSGLSDDQLEYQIEDRRSLNGFLELRQQERVPDAKTFWAFRHRLSELELTERLCNQLFRQLKNAEDRDERLKKTTAQNLF